MSLITTMNNQMVIFSLHASAILPFEFNKKRNIVTYDDKENKISFFFSRFRKPELKYNMPQQFPNGQSHQNKTQANNDHEYIF